MNVTCMHLAGPPAEEAATLSLRHWDQDDPNELQGAHCFVPGEAARPRPYSQGLH